MSSTVSDGTGVSAEVPVKGPGSPRQVSFRLTNGEPVVFSTRSAISDASTKQSQSASYTQLRSKLTRAQTNRDVFEVYKFAKDLGQGSMGDVKLVKKRKDKVGGSARRDVQKATALRRKKENLCFRIPLLGDLLCHLTLNNQDELTGASHHSAISFLSSKSEDMTQSTGVTTATRGFEDSLVDKTGKASNNEIVYAMKSIHLEQLGDQTYIDELRNEIALLKDLDHPNIVRAIETFEYKGKISIIMELCSGGDLYTREPYTELEAARILSSILSAVAYMHSRRVVHRDLKFENVLFVNLSPLSDVKLIDFGLSKVYKDSRKITDVVGTVYTMAPEVIMGDYTEKADIWSIGVIAFMLLSSSMPFYGKDRVHVIKRIINNKYHFKAKRWTRVSNQAKEFVQELLAAEADQRPDAESALGSAWLNSIRTDSSKSDAEEEAMAQSAMLKYADYPKLKKLALMVVAHKSTASEIGILRKLFDKYNTGSHGSIEFESFCKAFKASGSGLSDEKLRYVFDALDMGGSGTVLYTEFIAATIEALGAISEAQLAEAFDHLDDDDDGYITVSDMMQVLGADVPREELDSIISEVSLTNQGRLTYSEYMELFESNQTIADNTKVLSSELSSITMDSQDSQSEEAEGRAGFLQAKHHQNTLHTWALEMQLPAKVFAEGCSFLHQVALGDISELDKMLAVRPGLLNFRDYDRRTALHIAASEGLVDVCKYLVSKGARVNRADRWGGFPLDDAHRHHRTEVVNLLRHYKAKFGSTSKTANLIIAASTGNVKEVQALLEFGSMDLNQGDYDHRTALHLAANEGHLHVVELLVNAGAKVNVKDRWGVQPLDDAKKAKKNSAEIVAVLSGAASTTKSIHSTTGPAPRMDALKNESAPQNGASQPLEQDDEGMAQLSKQEFSMGCSVLHQSALGNKIVLQQLLLERPELVNFRDYDRRSPLHLAASEGQLEICEWLVKKGAKINRVDRWGGSALDDAHRGKYVEVVQFLRSQGAKFGSTSQGTNFITAAAEGDREEVEAFLEFGTIDINQGDYDKRTALHLAAGEGHLDICQLLCEAGADVNVEDRWGHRPLDEAGHAKKNSDAMMKLLLDHGAKSKNILTFFKRTFLGVTGSAQ